MSKQRRVRTELDWTLKKRVKYTYGSRGTAKSLKKRRRHYLCHSPIYSNISSSPHHCAVSLDPCTWISINMMKNTITIIFIDVLYSQYYSILNMASSFSTVLFISEKKIDWWHLPADFKYGLRSLPLESLWISSLFYGNLHWILEIL